MNPMMYAVLPRMGKYVISLCHIWFGVERSNRRGGGFGDLRAFGGGAVRPVAFRCWRTVSGLALRKNSRRRICEMRFAPCRGSSLFSCVILACTAAGSFAPPPPPDGLLRPCSPYRLYCLAHWYTVASEIPISRAMIGPAIPSSR
jgi:hypothetical protein